MTTIAEAITRCRLACGAEAVAREFPEQAGYDMYDGAVADDLNGWSDAEYLQWFDEMIAKYSRSKDLLELYNRCNEIMGEYAPLFKQADDTDISVQR